MDVTLTEFEFNSYINKIQGSLFGFIFSFVCHKQDAEDILQKTNLILCEKQGTFNPKLGSFKSWAFKIARFQVMAYRTNRKRSKISFSNELTEVLAEEAKDYETPHIQREALNKCYKKLPIHMQKIAELRFKRDLPLKDICESTNKSIGYISGTLNRIRGNILNCITESYKEAEQEFYK